MKLFKKLWQVLTRLSLSFWLLVTSSLLMVANTMLANFHAQTYHNLNTTPIWTWLIQMRRENLLIFVAVSLLIASLAMLALNTFACTLSRLAELSRRGKEKRPWRSRVVSWAPTLMHILFFLIMAGHMATFTLGKWRLHTVHRGENLIFSEKFAPLEITGFSRESREVAGVLKGSTIAHSVEVRLEGRSAVIRELKPLKLPNGDWLLLQAPQQKSGRKGRGPVEPAAEAPVDCSLEERHVKPIAFNPEQAIKLKQVFDPGVYFLFGGFCLIMVLLTTYYLLSWRNRGRSDPA